MTGFSVTTSTLLLQPLLAMVGLTMAVWLLMLITRLQVFAHLKVDPNEMGSPEKVHAVLPPRAQNPSNNFKNLFEIPVLFYLLCLVVTLNGSATSTDLYLAWGFVASRAAHSAIQCSYNNVNHRFLAYLIGCVLVATLLVRALIAL